MARKKRWIPILIVIALLAAAPAFVGVAWWRAHRRLQALVQVLPHAYEKVWYAEYRRPCLFGDPLPGNAWNHYYKVGREIAASGEISDELAAILNSAYPVRFPAPADLARLRDDHRAWLDEIFAGLRCETLRRIPDSEGELFARPAFLLACAEAERQSGRDAEALRLLSAVLAVSGDWRRGAHPSVVVDGFEPERTAAVLWRVALSNHALTPADLESACRLLDRIEEVRPSLADAIRSHHEPHRALVVESHPKTADSYDERPDWRHLWSWTFKMCEVADDLDRQNRAILALEARPSWARQEGLSAMDAEIDRELKSPGRRRRPTDLLPAPTNGYLHEASGRSLRDLIRVATALAWFEVETGRMPERLADLVPRYLPRDPLCAATGEPVPYAGGVLTTPEAARSGFSREAGGIDWTIRRR